MLCDIVGAIHESPENKLTEYGEITKNVIEEIPARFNVSIPKFVIMPNHVHLIMEVGFDAERREIRESPLRNNRSVVDKTVGYLKMNVSKRIHSISPGIKIWQRSYHDHIIRGEKDYQKIWEYIDTNAAKWKDDCFYNA